MIASFMTASLGLDVGRQGLLVGQFGEWGALIRLR